MCVGFFFVGKYLAFSTAKTESNGLGIRPPVIISIVEFLEKFFILGTSPAAIVLIILNLLDWM